MERRRITLIATYDVRRICICLSGCTFVNAHRVCIYMCVPSSSSMSSFKQIFNERSPHLIDPPVCVPKLRTEAALDDFVLSDAVLLANIFLAAEEQTLHSVHHSIRVRGGGGFKIHDGPLLRLSGIVSIAAKHTQPMHANANIYILCGIIPRIKVLVCCSRTTWLTVWRFWCDIYRHVSRRGA